MVVFLFDAPLNATYPVIDYIYTYRDAKEATERCSASGSDSSSGSGSSSGSSSSSGGSHDALMWSLIGIILFVLIGICVAFGINHNKKQRQKKESENRTKNLLMENRTEPDNLLRKWNCNNMQRY